MIDKKLIGKTVTAIADEFISSPLAGIIIEQTASAISIRLRIVQILPNGSEASHLVAEIRFKDQSIENIVSTKWMGCNLTLVPNVYFNSSDPCNLSWWRGGGAAIGDVRLEC